MKKQMTVKKIYLLDFSILLLIGLVFIFITEFINLKEYKTQLPNKYNFTFKSTSKESVVQDETIGKLSVRQTTQITNDSFVQVKSNNPVTMSVIQNDIILDADENDVGIYFKRKLEYFLVNQNGFKYSDCNQVLELKRQFIEDIEQNNLYRENLGHVAVDQLNVESEEKYKTALIRILGSNFYNQFIIWSQDQEKIIADSLAGDREPLSNIN